MRIHIKTFGCSANVAESEMMAGILSKKHLVSTSELDSDVIVINSCTVKGDVTVLREVRRIKEANPDKRIVIGGCVSTTLRKSIRELDPIASFLTTQNIRQIQTAVDNPRANILKPDENPKLKLPRQRTHEGIAIIPISNGCLDHCTYCSTKLSKGNLQSYPVQSILDEVARSVDEGCKQIWITSQDTSAYGQDIGTNLARLVSQIAKIPGEFTIRIGMGNPTYFLEYRDELADVLNHDKVYSFVHIPVQAGNNKVLTDMKRRYTAEAYGELISYLRTQVSDLTVATDIIVGFPGETDEEFQDTLRLVEELNFDVVNISRFVARKGTVAYNMKNKLNGAVLKDRSRLLHALFERQSLAINQELVGWTGNVIAEMPGKNNTTICRTLSYKPVILEGIHSPGSVHTVSIDAATTYHLLARKVEVDTSDRLRVLQ